MTKPLVPQVHNDKEDELREPTPQEAEYLRRQQDPYAKLSVSVRDGSAEARAADGAIDPLAKLAESKVGFDAECRRIFGFYVPAVEKGRIRQHHRDFILRNISRPPSVRYRLLTELRKYDVSQTASLEARFNRGEDITEAKLRQIEQLAGIY